MMMPISYRPVESHSWARETLSRDPIPSFCMSWDWDAEGVEREETLGELSTIRLRVRGSVVSSPSGVRGRAPAENGFYAYFRSERSHLEHHIQYFWVTAGLPKCRGARENFPPFPPSRRAWLAKSNILVLQWNRHKGFVGMIAVFHIKRFLRTNWKIHNRTTQYRYMPMYNFTAINYSLITQIHSWHSTYRSIYLQCYIYTTYEEY